MQKLFLLVFFLSLTTGCATTCDPTQGGLLGGIRLASTDCGEKRIDAKIEELNVDKIKLTHLGTEHDELKAKKQLTRQEYLDLEIEIEQIDRDTKILQARIRNLKATTAKARSQKSSIQNRIGSLKQQIAQAKQQLANQSLTKQQYQQKIQKLKTEIDELWKVYNALQ